MRRSFGAAKERRRFRRHSCSSLNRTGTYGDVSLAQGWNLSTYSQGTFVTAPTTLAQAKAMIEENFGNFDPAWLPFDEMDEYTKSFFAPISGTKYKRLGNDALRIEFNLYGK